MTFTAPSRGELRRSSILKAAVRVIAEEGVRAVTHRRVAAEARASLGLITYHFASTDALIAATLDFVASEEAEQMARLRERIAAAHGDLTILTEIFVDDVTERATTRRETVLAGLALTLEIPRLTIDREGFGAWESANEAAMEQLLRALGHEPMTELVQFLEAALDGIYMYAVISKDPAGLIDAARVGLTKTFRLLAADAPISRPEREL